MSRVALWLALAGASASGLVAPAGAAELAASGPEHCPDAGELTFRVERALGAGLGSAPPLRFDVRFEATGLSGYQAHLVVEPAGPLASAASRSERVLSARHCGPLGDAVAVAIALALGAAKTQSAAAPADRPTGGPGAPSPPPGSEDAGGPDSEPVFSARRAAAAASDTPSSGQGRGVLEPALAVAVVGDAGSLPGAGLGLELGVLVRSGGLALRASGTLFLDRHVALSNGGDATLGANMALALGNLSACTTPVGDPLGFAGLACAGWELGRLDAIGTGVEQPRRGSALWSAPRVDAGVGWRGAGGAFGLFARVAAVAPLVRDEFFLRELGTVHRPPAVAGRLSLGVDVIFR